MSSIQKYKTIRRAKKDVKDVKDQYYLCIILKLMHG